MLNLSVSLKLVVGWTAKAQLTLKEPILGLEVVTVRFFLFYYVF